MMRPSGCTARGVLAALGAGRGAMAQAGGALSVILAALFGLQAAAPPPAPHDGGQTALALLDGRELYETHCETCHRADGQGIPGLYPPLDGTDWVTGDKGRLLRILLHGMQGDVDVKGVTYSSRMPGWGTILGDAEIAQVATYVRSSWSNHASEVSTNEVRRVRRATAGRDAPWTAALLRSSAHTGIPERVADDGRSAAAQETASSGHPYPVERPDVYRTFMPESSPASIAVGLPDDQSYCFDASVGYIRYAWQGGYIDNTEQWDGNGNAFTALQGDIYYRNQVGFPFRFGQGEDAPPVDFWGYRLVGEGYPEFRYTVRDVEIRELVKPHPEQSGLVRTFTVDGLDGPLWFVVGGEQAGVRFEASAGAWQGPWLRLTPAEAATFTITMLRHDSSAP
ncbi:MAG: c-type cytochrome [Bacteroidetes bacterium]|nr:c-type cytochrome [Bacteroidota bacterium]